MHCLFLAVGEDAKGIPEFWLTILKNVPLFQEMVQEHDEPILAKLQDIKVTFSPPGEQMVNKLFQFCIFLYTVHIANWVQLMTQL